MSDREQQLGRVLKDALRAEEPAATPSFSRLWTAAQAGREEPAAAFSGWAESFAAGAAVASVVAIGILIAANVRKNSDDRVPDTALYAQLITQASWASPTDALLDTTARYSVAGLPELPAINTDPSLEPLL